MARIDQHRLTKLHRGFDEIRTLWNEIKCSSSEFVHHGEHNSLEIAKSSTATRVYHFLSREFAAWSAQVVDAFGLDPFPSYELEPPRVEDCNDSNSTRIQLISGFEDPIQAGLLIILWAAIFKKPELLLPVGSDQWCATNYCRGFERWAENLIVGCHGSFVADPDLMQWVAAAFEQLEKQFAAGQQDRMSPANETEVVFTGQSTPPEAEAPSLLDSEQTLPPETATIFRRVQRDGAQERSNIESDADATQTPLDRNDVAILTILNESSPRMLKQCEIEEASELSRRTVGLVLARLRLASYTHRPRGKRGGETLTELGRAVALRCAQTAH